MATEDKEVQATSTGHETKKRWGWGFAEKTGWDWLQMLIQLLAALAIPIAIAVGTQWFSYQQNQTSLQVAQDQQQEATLETYLDRMSDLMLNSKLLENQPGQATKASIIAGDVARARTLTALRRLDPGRKGLLLQFLHQSLLIGEVGVRHGGEIVHLAAIVDLRGADLRGADLRGTDLTGAILSGVNLAGAELAGAELSWADLSGADLSNADLTGADLFAATLTGAKVTAGQLTKARNLYGATMPDGSKHP